MPKLPGRSELAILGRGQVIKWPNNTVIYRIGNLTERMKADFQRAIDEWESKTSIRFKERTTESYFVNVQRTGDNCSCGVASLGVQGSRGFLRFGSRAPVAVIVHEIGHTLGFIHEQNKADRDNKIRVNFENIQDRGRDQFFLARNSTPLTSELDVNSTMMYGSYTFTKNGRPTIVDLNGRPLPRNSGLLSAGDVSGTNQAYPGAGGTNGQEEEEEEEETNNGGGVTVPNRPVSNVCDGVGEFNRFTSYRVGDRVTFRGYLFERDFTRWNLLKRCGVDQSDICQRVSEFVGTSIYQVGDKVTYRGSLYKRVNGGWIREGQCGN